jgi:flagellar protein FliL
MATEILDVPAKKPGLVGRLMRGILYLIIAAVLVSVGFGGGYFYFANPLSPQKGVLSLIDGTDPAAAATEATNPDLPQKVVKETPDKEEFVTSYYTFKDPLTSNLAGGRRILQVTVGLSTEYDAKVFEHVEANLVALQSDMLAVASGVTEADLSAPGGREKLAGMLRDAINARLEAIEGFGGINAVFFPSFILQ